MYDHLISEQQMPPHEALEVMMGQSRSNYSENVIAAFVKAIPPYPPGTKVRLRDENEAVVTRIVHHIQRPCIRYVNSGE